MIGSVGILRAGMWLAWSAFALYLIYIATLFAGGVAVGVPREPFLTAAEILSIVGAVLQVALFGTIHSAAPTHLRFFSLMALAWMVAMAAVTSSVHFVQLTVARRIDVVAVTELRYVFGWEWPSLLYGLELVAWHLLLGLSLIFAAPVFAGKGRLALVRVGLYLAGGLCLLGIIGPAVGNLSWRFIGVFGYGVILPVVFLLLGFVFRDSGRQHLEPHGP
jgi:hypothetical protein